MTVTVPHAVVTTVVEYSHAGAVIPLQFGGNLLYLAIVFFVLALLSALVGLRGVAGVSMEIARILVFVFLVLAILSLLL